MKVVILGGQGDGLVAAQIIEDMSSQGQDIELVGFLNDHEAMGSLIGGYPVLGKTSEWHNLPEEWGYHFSLLSVGKMRERALLIKSFNIPIDRVVSLIHPTALISRTASVGKGTLVAAYAVMQPGSQLGLCCSVRAGANIGHDVSVGDFVYVGPNATLCGYSGVAEGVFLAPNSVLRDRTKMGEYSVLAAASVAYKDVPENSTWIGNPARRIA